MKYLAMIQARCGSTRLPNKVLKDLCGKPQLQRVIERVSMSSLIEEVMVITSIEKENLPILRLCADIGIRVGIGSENDVLDRYYQTARLLKPEYVIRVTGDCPLIDGKLIDEGISAMSEGTDYCGNPMSATFADGLDFEIISYNALEQSWRDANHSYEREHVTQYIIRHQDKFNYMDFKSAVGNFGDQRWTVDEPEDFEFVKRVYKHFIEEEKQEDFRYIKVLAYLKENPDLLDINRKIRRNEGLRKSIREDYIVDK